MVVKPLFKLQLTRKAFCDELLKLALAENVIVAMVDCRLLVCVLYRRLNEVRVLWARFFTGLLCLLICVMKVPGNKDILCCKLPVLLLIRPDIYQHCSTDTQNAMHFGKSLDPQTIAGKVMHDSDRDHIIERV